MSHARRHKPKTVYTLVKEPLTPEEQKEGSNQWLRISAGVACAAVVLGGLFVLIVETHTAAPVEAAVAVERKPANERTCKETANMTRDVMQHDGYSNAAADAQADRFLQLCYSTGKK